MSSRQPKSFNEVKKDWTKYLSLWRAKPDLFLDFVKDPKSNFELYFYQRIMLRILFRYRKVFMTFTRGTSKSFMQILALFLRCIMFPKVKLFISAPRKEQATKIAKDNLDDILDFFPILANEIDWKRSRFEKDYIKVFTLNGSRLDIVQVAQAERGGRRHGGSIEEIVDEAMKKDLLNEVVIPLMANDRRAMCGGVDRHELHKSEHYITTAGQKQSFAYDKLQEVMWEMSQGKSAFSIGASYELATLVGQLDEEFINDVKERPTYSPLSFSREYESVWTGSSDSSFVQLDDLRECRTLRKSEDKAVDKKGEYILSYDVARAEGKKNADSALCIIKIIPRTDGTYQKHLVNVYSMEGTHFREQAIFLKRKVNDFKARMLCIDVNGLGKGLVDYLVTEIDENPAYEVVNDDRYDRYKTGNSIPIIYGISSNTKETKASDINNVFMSMIANHKVQMLVTESQARSSMNGKKLDSEKMVRALFPHTMTDLLQDELMNLEYKQSGNDTRIIQISKGINKDKFSAFSYGLYYIYLLENKNQIKKREKGDAWKFMAVRKPKAVI